MRKLVYVLWKAEATPIGELRARLLEQAGPRLLRAGVPGLSVCVADLEIGRASCRERVCNDV